MADSSSELSTAGELAAALHELYRGLGLSYSQLDARARKLPGAPTLARSTLSDMLNGRPPSRDTLLTFLTVCGVSLPDQRQWLSAWQRARDGHKPRGGARVRDISPRELGVHAAIREHDSVDDLPPYVGRDLDKALRAAVSKGAEQGCFVLLLGSSSVGKTRSAYEAVLALVPDWWLVQPAEVADIRALADSPARHTVVWLDELQRYLDQQQPVAEWVRTLCRAGAIVIGTLWPDEYLIRAMPAAQGEKDRQEQDRELLRMARVIDVAGVLSDDERRRAVSLGETDSRIRAALTVSDAGLVQILAAGPAMVRWWEQSPSPYARAVITAAADARRLGVRSTLPRSFFANAVHDYLTPAQRATASPGWLDAALTYALTQLQGAAATLVPVPTERLGEVAGYRAADYLVQHARRARRTTVPPATWWQAMAEHCQDSTDLYLLARAARARARYQYVELLHRQRADRGDTHAAAELGELLEDQGRMDEAITMARAEVAAGTPFAIRRLARLLVAEGETEEAIALLWPPNDGSHWYYAEDLERLLVKLGRTEDAVGILRDRATAGDSNCASRLVDLFLNSGRVDDALVVLRNPVNPPYLKWQLATLLADRGRADEAIDTMKTCADTEFGAERLIHLAVRHGRVDELRVLADQGDGLAIRELAGLLADQGRAQELATLADEHSHHLPFGFALRKWLADVLGDQGAVEELRRRADAGDEPAGFRLAETLIEQDRVDEVRARASTGDRCATWRLAQHLERLGRLEEAVEVWRSWHDVAETAQALTHVLLKQGRVDEAIQAALAGAEAGDRDMTGELSYLLDKYDRVDELRARAESGDTSAALTLAKKMRKQGRLDDALNVLTLAGNKNATAYLRAEFLRAGGRIAELRTLARGGCEWADRELVEILCERGLVAELRSVAHSGSSLARLRLIDILAEQGDVDGLRKWADAGDTKAARHLIRLLATHADLDELRAEVDAGTEGALAELLSLLVEHRQLSKREATRIRTFGFPTG